MLKSKTFRRDTEYSMSDVDSKLNKWLEKNLDIKIISHQITMQDEYLISQILYDDMVEGIAKLDDVLA
jgi:hypothetical protein